MSGSESAPKGVTIDAARARDLDDAIWVERTPDGFDLTVSIACVADIVPVGSSDDIMAASRCQTIYGSTTPRSAMFGPHIAESLASLLPGRARPALVTSISFDADGGIISSDIRVDTFRSMAKLPFETFESICARPDDRMNPMAMAAVDLASVLWKRRTAKIGMPRWASAFDQAGQIISGFSPGLLGQTIIHELMVASNLCATLRLQSVGVPMIFRNQGARAGGPGGRYEIVPMGHSALAEQAYGQFSNPIRNYVNLANQRQLRAAIARRPAPYSLSDMLRIATDGNRSMQRAEAASRQRSEDLDVQNHASSVERLDNQSFCTLIANAEGFDRRTMPDLDRRVTDGLLTHRDLSWLLFSRSSPVSDTQRADILQRLTANPEEMDAVWSCARTHQGFLPFETTSFLLGGRWTCRASIGRFFHVAHDDDPVRARGLALVGLAAAAFSIKMPDLPLPAGPGLRFVDMHAPEKLESLCRLMDWDGPEYNVEQKTSGIRRYHTGSVKVYLEAFPFETPHVSASGWREVEMAAADLALSLLQPLANDTLRRMARASGVDMRVLSNNEEINQPVAAIEDFCHRYGAALRWVWTKERPAARRYKCTLEMGASGNLLVTKGNGHSPKVAMELASRNMIATLLGHDHRPSSDVTEDIEAFSPQIGQMV